MAYAIITGGGKIGYYLTRSLINENYEVLLLEKNRPEYHRLSADLGDVVMHGDGCDPLVLKNAGVERADLIVVATGDDADNLVTCQMVAHCFGKTRIIARVNNPDNEEFFEKIGIKERVSGTRAILDLLGRKVGSSPLHLLGVLEKSNVEAVEIELGTRSPLIGQTLGSITLPKDTLIISVLRDGGAFVPDGTTTFQANDEIIALVPPQLESALRSFAIA